MHAHLSAGPHTLRLYYLLLPGMYRNLIYYHYMDRRDDPFLSSPPFFPPRSSATCTINYLPRKLSQTTLLVHSNRLLHAFSFFFTYLKRLLTGSCPRNCGTYKINLYLKRVPLMRKGSSPTKDQADASKRILPQYDTNGTSSRYCK